VIFDPHEPKIEPFKSVQNMSERSQIIRALHQRGTVTSAAEALRMTRQNLHRLMRKHNLVLRSGVVCDRILMPGSGRSGKPQYWEKRVIE
jgi:hypothetical protein